MHSLLADPWIAAHIEAAVAPFVGRLSPGELTWMRDQLAEIVAGDEHVARLAARARPVDVDESGELRRDRMGLAPSTPAARGTRRLG
jgi:hypothetical protein